MRRMVLALQAFGAERPMLSFGPSGVRPPLIRLFGVLGDYFDLIETNNFLRLDLKNDFFKPFRERKATDGRADVLAEVRKRTEWRRQFS